jgi:two-component system nitrate/nitrite sensor histidine kinase NarX
LATLLDISQHIASTLELEPLLDVILEQFRDLVAYEGASILALEGDTLQVIAYRGPIPQQEALDLRFPLAEARANKAVIENRETVIIGDVRADTPMARAFRRTAGERLGSTFDYVRSWMGVPLIARDETIGMLSLDYSEPNAYTGRHGLLALTFANKVAVAMENARLYAHAEKDATAAERNRLARELHDAVSQTLFSASLIAEVLPQLWEHNIDEGRRRLEELRELTRGALAEMRALLMELRPATLTETSLIDLLRQLAEATRGRSRLPVTLDVEGDRSLPPDVQVAFYRIAQEALHNVTKHAAAGAVSMRLRQAQDTVELIIEDDGRGFDVKQSRPDSLGLGIMRERAAGMGATLNLESEIGAGTTVTVCWQDEETEDG